MSCLKGMGQMITRSRLLATVSAATLAMLLQAEPLAAKSDEAGVWIDLGWHSEEIRDSGSAFALPIGNLIPASGITGPLNGEMNLSHSQGVDAKVTFRPDDTDWALSVSVRYGRSRGKGKLSQLETLPTKSFVTYHTNIPTYPFPYHRTRVQPLRQTQSKIDVETVSAESHYVLDFEAGKDVGLGLFGHGVASTFSAGVRFANFTSALNVKAFHADADFQITYTQTVRPTNAFFPSTTLVVPWYHTHGRQRWKNLAGNPHSSHDFIGIGPMISWDASAPLWGDPNRNGISLDWSVNAALLFGRQKNEVHHQTVITAECFGSCAAGMPYHDTTVMRTSKRATVPDVGGSIGISYRLHDFKLKLGYRDDTFFSALDRGIESTGTLDRSFRGPFLNIAFGLGE